MVLSQRFCIVVVVLVALFVLCPSQAERLRAPLATSLAQKEIEISSAEGEVDSDMSASTGSTGSSEGAMGFPTDLKSKYVDTVSNSSSLAEQPKQPEAPRETVITTSDKENFIHPTETVPTHNSEGRLYVANVNDTVLDTHEDVNCCHSEHIRLACCPVVGEASPQLQQKIEKYKKSKRRYARLEEKMKKAGKMIEAAEREVIMQREAEDMAKVKKVEEKKKYDEGLDIKIPPTYQHKHNYANVIEDLAVPV